MVYNLIKLYGENSLQSSYADTIGITTFNEENQSGLLTYLPDAISATVTEELNGQFDLEMSYPVTGDGYKDISVNRIIACKPNPYSSIQAFRIYKVTKPLDGIVQVFANHISYDLNSLVIDPFSVTNKTPDQVIKAIGNHCATDDCDFSFSSDINKTVSKFSISTPKTIREVLGGNLSNELSLVQTCSGEFEFDNLKVSLKQARGTDNGVRISYGKNLTEFKFDEDSTEYYTRVMPYWSTTKKPDENSTSASSTSSVSVSGSQTYTATAQYGNMNLCMDVSKVSATSIQWRVYFKIVIQGGYNFNYQNSLDVSINGAKVFSSGNVRSININGMSVDAEVVLVDWTTTTVPSTAKSVPVAATFIQRQDTRGTWKISANFGMTGEGTEVVTNVESDDIYYCVTLNGDDKIHEYSGTFNYEKTYALDLSKDIEIPKDPNDNNKYIYPDNTPAGQQSRNNIRNQLATAFQKYLAENEDPTVFSDSLEISFVDLTQSEEYKDYVGLETVNIGDIVTVEFPLYNVTRSKECVKTEYDVLSDSYVNLTLGEITDTLASTIQNGVSLASRNTVTMKQLKEAGDGTFNHVQALTGEFHVLQADYAVFTSATIGSLSAIYGSFSSLSAEYAYINFANIESAAISNLTAHSAWIDYLSTNSAFINNLTANSAWIKYLSTNSAFINKLTANSAFIDYLSASSAFISYLTANSAWIKYLSANSAFINNLTANSAWIKYLSADSAFINNLTANSAWINYVSANSVFASYLVANSAVIGSLSAYFAKVDFANITNAAITTLTAKSAFISALDAKWANISFANISLTNVQSLFAKTGMISDLTIQSGHLTGELQFVTLRGDLIEVGTLVADRLVFVGDDGLYYQLNTNGVTVTAQQTEYNSLNGSVITAQSVTADKIYVSDLYAFGATIANLVLESGSIHTVNKTSPDNTTTGIFISSNSFAIGASRHYLRYWKDTGDNNTWKLEVKGVITANEGSIAGWGIDTNVLYKETTTDPTIVTSQTQYRAGMGAPSNPGSSNRAFFLRSRTTEDGGLNYSAWDDLFAVFYNGKMIAKNADIEGKITAAEGKIGGWTIGATTLSGTNGSSGATEGYIQYTAIQQVPASFDPTDYAYAVRQRTYTNGAWTSWNYQFIVRYNGKLIAKNAEIEGKVTATTLTLGTDATIPYSKITGAPDVTVYISKDGQIGTAPSGAPTPSGSKGFKVTSDGLLIANNGVFYGTIYASAGTIGGWDISSDILDKYSNGKPEGTAADGTITRRMYLQPAGGNAIGLIEWTYSTASSSWVRSNKFVLTWAGKLTAIDAEITGKVTATSGYIGGSGGWVITTGKIYKGTAGSSKGIFLDATAGTTATVAGASHANLMIGIGANFGVDKDGCLFGTNVSISGSITATSGSFLCSSTGSQIYINSGAIVIRNANGTKVGEISHNSSSFNIVGVTGYNLNIGYGVSTTINIGYGASSINLGNSATGDVYSVAIAESTASSSGSYVRVDTDGLLHRYSSSIRYKTNIKVIDQEDSIFDGLLKIKPKYYTYKNLKETDQRFGELMPGLIAEDILEHYPIACQKNQEGQPDDFDDRMVLVGTLSLLQKLYKRVDELERKLSSYDK